MCKYSPRLRIGVGSREFCTRRTAWTRAVPSNRIGPGWAGRRRRTPNWSAGRTAAKRTKTGRPRNRRTPRWPRNWSRTLPWRWWWRPRPATSPPRSSTFSSRASQRRLFSCTSRWCRWRLTGAGCVTAAGVVVSTAGGHSITAVLAAWTTRLIVGGGVVISVPTAVQTRIGGHYGCGRCRRLCVCRAMTAMTWLPDGRTACTALSPVPTHSSSATNRCQSQINMSPIYLCSSSVKIMGPQVRECTNWKWNNQIQNIKNTGKSMKCVKKVMLDYKTKIIKKKHSVKCMYLAKLIC